jgi:hypothetical protein
MLFRYIFASKNDHKEAVESRENVKGRGILRTAQNTSSLHILSALNSFLMVIF